MRLPANASDPWFPPRSSGRDLDFRPWPLALSVATHGLLLAGIAVAMATPGARPAPPSLPVELVSPEELRTATARSLPLPPVPQPVAEAPPAPPAAPLPAGDGLTVATTLYAGAILDDPANRAIREALPTLERSERIIQLCNVEGLEQLRAARPGTTPDFLVGYAFADVTVDGYTLDAPGAAYHEGQEWHRVRFTCSVDATFDSVTDFRFEIGDDVPESEWANHNLPGTVADE
ncbi:MAG: DUF930 domain-containing protein [Bauldia sp.]|nr:DUF930 domain-containing protein [Bauldia sp.]